MGRFLMGTIFTSFSSKPKNFFKVRYFVIQPRFILLQAMMIGRLSVSSGDVALAILFFLKFFITFANMYSSFVGWPSVGNI